MSHKKILAISSGGGHWKELLRVLPGFESYEVVFATVDSAYRHDVSGSRLYQVTDSCQWDRGALLKTFLEVLWVVVKERPAVVFSTGAAPGFFGLFWGKLLGARTIWLDSVANVDRLSLSGRLARRFADLWLTQWPHLACEDGPVCRGQVL